MPSPRPTPLRVAARLDNLKVIRDHVEALARAAGFADMRTYAGRALIGSGRRSSRAGALLPRQLVLWSLPCLALQ
jgi:hypothetical protein